MVVELAFDDEGRGREGLMTRFDSNGVNRKCGLEFVPEKFTTGGSKSFETKLFIFFYNNDNDKRLI